MLQKYLLNNFYINLYSCFIFSLFCFCFILKFFFYSKLCELQPYFLQKMLFFANETVCVILCNIFKSETIFIKQKKLLSLSFTWTVHGVPLYFARFARLPRDFFSLAFFSFYLMEIYVNCERKPSDDCFFYYYLRYIL